MHPVRKKRIVTISVILVVLATAIGLVMYALSQNINLFYSPTQVETGEAPQGVTLRAGGMVVENSVERASDNLNVAFLVTDYKHSLRIEYKGILPDLFREGQGIVAQGKLDERGVLIASEVLAKHDEEYMPPEVSAALEQSKAQ
ncbi:Cytochrome c-type biogenesis protein CcmE [Marinomonas gallaica]|uniref:Cytochrome c-type biogenesis protein CcmE n=1 Tax=Marinomonas gallaica TaxID=1806667 RepID=A0A1C3JLX0_9GAMM|nr:cytochrome c maturation protein CcmE [Marinomonas gallaica]SBT16212.1 Cytochrome c-type biogenesis protein CcmE [Marinomonas gallaica]SBT21260.1 Cytochrome c-type biogenesis protein CcmE [Marinomonas gallaica]